MKPATIEAARCAREEDQLPVIGDYYWVAGKGKGDDAEERLMVVCRVRSNYVDFHETGSRLTTSYRYVRHEDLLARIRKEPDWQRILGERLEAIRREMEAATKRLLDDALSKGAISEAVDPSAAPCERSCMLPAIRVADPKAQKQGLIALRESIPATEKAIEQLAEEFAGTSKMLMLPELTRLQAMKKRLKVVESQIFTIEVYAGLQEEVLQIADGEPAPMGTPITIRQSMLYMDEETLFDFDKGGMDFEKLEDFDKWVARPESIARILPEPRGVVAFRVRRNPKSYGIPKSIWEAWSHMENNQWNMETYLVLKNGERIYRIASAVDFSPRLIPLRSEFDGAFKERKWGGFGVEDKLITVTPRDHAYDDKAEELRDSLLHYNRIVILIQGLLDRSEVFHPHPVINLSSERDLEAWLRFMRDEEDAISSTEETWNQYQERLNSQLKPGDTIYTAGITATRVRPRYSNHIPKLIAITKVRPGTERDAFTAPYRNGGSYDSRYRYKEAHSRTLKSVVGVPGVEISWPRGKREGYEHGDWGEWGERETKTMFHEWVPLTEIFNVSAYQLGDYKRFAGSRTQKQLYLKWAPALLTAEKWRQAHPATPTSGRDANDIIEEMLREM